MATSGGELVLVVLFFACLVVAAVNDFQSRTIPDKVVAAICCVWLAQVALRALSGESSWLIDASQSLGAAALLCAVLLLFVSAYEAISGKAALGGGDVKLLSVAALYLGPSKVLLLIFFAFSLGIVMALAYRVRGSRTFPFGPAIALGSMISCLL